MSADAAIENEIRADERRRLSDLIAENADEIGAYAADSVAAVRLVAMLIGLSPTAGRHDRGTERVPHLQGRGDGASDRGPGVHAVALSDV